MIGTKHYGVVEEGAGGIVLGGDMPMVVIVVVGGCRDEF